MSLPGVNPGGALPNPGPGAGGAIDGVTRTANDLLNGLGSGGARNVSSLAGPISDIAAHSPATASQVRSAVEAGLNPVERGELSRSLAAGTNPSAPAGTPPGHGGTPPGHGGTPPGQAAAPPGHAGPATPSPATAPTHAAAPNHIGVASGPSGASTPVAGVVGTLTGSLAATVNGVEQQLAGLAGRIGGGRALPGAIDLAGGVTATAAAATTAASAAATGVLAAAPGRIAPPGSLAALPGSLPGSLAAPALATPARPGVEALAQALPRALPGTLAATADGARFAGIATPLRGEGALLGVARPVGGEFAGRMLAGQVLLAPGALALLLAGGTEADAAQRTPAELAALMAAGATARPAGPLGAVEAIGTAPRQAAPSETQRQLQQALAPGVPPGAQAEGRLTLDWREELARLAADLDAHGLAPDEYGVVRLERGATVYGALPGETAFYTDQATFDAAGNSRERLFESVQRPPHAEFGHPPLVGEYQLKADVEVPFGIVRANPGAGPGEGVQYVIRDWAQALHLVRELPLAA